MMYYTVYLPHWFSDQLLRIMRFWVIFPGGFNRLVSCRLNSQVFECFECCRLRMCAIVLFYRKNLFQRPPHYTVLNFTFVYIILLQCCKRYLIKLFFNFIRYILVHTPRIQILHHIIIMNEIDLIRDICLQVPQKNGKKLKT